MKKVQAFITNISFPKNLDEFLYFLNDSFHFNVDDILYEEYLEWTAPRWCKKDDIVFFMHSKTTKSIITRLRTEYQKNKKNYTKEECRLIEKGIEHALNNYKKYGGKIYAIGRVVEPPIYDDFQINNNIELHWKGKIYAPISDIIILDNPIDISEFNDFIFISRQSAITGVFGKEFEKLKKIILSKNKTKMYFRDSVSTVLPIKDINETNWLSLSNEFRRGFFLESQFRSYYVDYLLDDLTDNKVYKECSCKTKNLPDCYIDNIIFFNNKPLLIEIKLNINNEVNIIDQMKKYCNCDFIRIGNKNYNIENCYNDKALIIDTEKIYLYTNKTKNIESIYNLDKLKTKNDIICLIEIINKNLNCKN